jgi:Endosomal/lysosomal potassium channel TMEM175
MTTIRNGIGIERGDKVTRLEAFVDAAFAFAVTLLVISGDHIPDSIPKLIEALKQVPSYAASFALIMRFWWSHADWSRRFGLEDAICDRLSLLLVFFLLIFVYPLKMVFASLFAVLSGGYLPTQFVVGSPAEVPVMFQTFAIGFGSMAAVMCALHRRAMVLAIAMGFTAAEVGYARFCFHNWALVVAFCVLSLTLACTLPTDLENNWLLGLPGFIFFAMNLFQWVLKRRYEAAARPPAAV